MSSIQVITKEIKLNDGWNAPDLEYFSRELSEALNNTQSSLLADGVFVNNITITITMNVSDTTDLVDNSLSSPL